MKHATTPRREKTRDQQIEFIMIRMRPVAGSYSPPLKSVVSYVNLRNYDGSHTRHNSLHCGSESSTERRLETIESVHTNQRIRPVTGLAPVRSMELRTRSDTRWCSPNLRSHTSNLTNRGLIAHRTTRSHFRIDRLDHHESTIRSHRFLRTKAHAHP